jgi:Peptidase family M28
MDVLRTVSTLTAFEQRGAGSNAERRAGLWLATELRGPHRDAKIETFWCRPNWALAHAWHVALAVAGSLVSVGSAKVGGALILVALVSLAVDALTGRSLGRRLTPERASQNVVSRAAVGAAGPSAGPAPGGRPAVTLVITANYDAGRAGLAYRGPLRRTAARLGRATGRIGPGWLGWLALAFTWLLVTALLRAGGAGGTVIGVAQLVPTAALVLSLALLLELASAEFTAAANDNASGVALALALTRVLDAAPPRRLAVDVVLQGAGDGGMIGLARHLRARRGELTRGTAVVLGIGACGAGEPAWWTADGPLIPLRFLRRLGDIAQRATGAGTEIGATAHRGRGTTPAFPARLAGLPAITIGNLDRGGLSPRSHQRGDIPEALDRGAIDRLLTLALTLIDAIDADLRRSAASSQGSTPTARV